MTPLWTSDDAIAATGGTATRPFTATGVSIDTRTLAAGDLFVALQAARDGHEFVAQALENGAAAALVSHRPANLPEDAPLLIVPDVLAALEALGRAARARTGARVVAVTGSVGKTSTKEMLRAMCSGQGRTHAAVASYNNHWGVPLTLARMPADTEFAVIEIGMNHPGEIAPLARMARPHVAMVTTVAAAHLEAFGALEGIAVEKGSICEGLEPDGAAVLHGDLETTPLLIAAADKAKAERILFGTGSNAAYRLDEARIREGHTVARAATPHGMLLFKVASEGRHFAMNALAALAACDALGLDLAQAIMDLGHWHPPAGRGGRERVVIDPARSGEWFELIDDAFNANPASLSAALDVLAASVTRDGVGRTMRGRRIAILGDMLELGEDELSLHRVIADDPALLQVSVVHCAGRRMKSLWDALPDERKGLWAETAEELSPQVIRRLDAGDVVLVKGSKGSRVSLIVDAIRKLGQRSPQSESEG
jgi:UDP-N-acetylmuramoyl-tripeptide--D-alanyl-D-alanine ligase